MVKTIAFSQRIYFNTLSEQSANTIQNDLKTFNSMVHSTYKILLNNMLKNQQTPKESIVKTLNQRYHTNSYFPWNTLTQAKTTLAFNIQINQRLQRTLARQIKQTEKKLNQNLQRLTNLNQLQDSLITISKSKMIGIQPPNLQHYAQLGALWSENQPETITIHHEMMNLYLFEVNQLKPQIKQIKSTNKRLRNRINILKNKLNNATKKIQPIRFGSKRLMKERTTKKLDHEQWLTKYQQIRNKNMLISGTKNNKYSNALFHYDVQNGQMTYFGQNNQTIKFQLQFEYKASELKQKLKLPAGTNNKNVAYHLENHGAYFIIKAIFEETLDKKYFLGDTSIGTIGLDINLNHFALTEIDSHGNIVGINKINYDLRGKTKNQRIHIIREKAKEIMSLCLQANKTLIIEKLDFEKTRSNMDDYSKKRKKQINEFAYQSIIQAIQSRANKLKIETYQINPAYTSIIGYLKYSKAKGLSTHFCAAYVIARKGMGFNEKITKQLSKTLTPRQKRLSTNQKWEAIFNQTF